MDHYGVVPVCKKYFHGPLPFGLPQQSTDETPFLILDADSLKCKSGHIIIYGIFVYVCIYLCLCVYMYMCVYICMCVHMYIHVCRHVDMWIGKSMIVNI